MLFLALAVFALLSAPQAAAGELPASFGRSLQDLSVVSGSSLRTTLRNIPAMPSSSPDDLDVRRVATHLRTLVPDRLSAMRGEREVRLYAATSTSVVLIITETGIGSGSLIRPDGTILTNWHVVSSSREAGIVFKPTMEGRRLTKADVYRGRVVRVDELSDLALVKSEGVAPQARPLPLGSMQDVKVGSDVHAIGHPTGESWTYTKGFVSQVRKGYEWSIDSGATHRADVIQTQTPINPGNSGGPLLNDEGRLVGVNSFKAEGEGLNFAVSVDDVRRLLASTADRRLGRAGAVRPSPSAQAKCEPREVRRGRSAEGDADRIVYDLDCTGTPNAVLTVPDDSGKPITLFIEGKGADPNVLLIDTDRDGTWDISLYDIDKDGKPDMIGYHRNGELKPYRLEPYAASR